MGEDPSLFSPTVNCSQLIADTPCAYQLSRVELEKGNYL